MTENERRSLIKILESLHAVCEDLAAGRRVLNQLNSINTEIGKLQGLFNRTEDERN